MSYLKDLNSVQRKAVEALNGPVMIIAGAGSGKTRVLTYRIAHLIHSGVPASQILALTFTNKAAREMKERAEALVGDETSYLWIGTFHSIFARILRKEAEHIGYSRSFTIYDTDDSLAAIKRCFETLGISTQELDPKNVRSRISSSKNQMISASAYSQKAIIPTEIKIARIYEEYEALLRRSNGLDFDDLLLKPIELFKRNPTILERYVDRIRFILIDEFQDTNKAQYEVAKMLAGKFKNICVVGDDAQSIYAFRGADIRNIFDFSKDFPHAQVYRLEQNYRSTKRILSVANDLIQHNEQQFHKIVWTENSEGDKVSVIECNDDRDEAQKAVNIIKDEGLNKKIDLKEIAILYRTNAQSRALEDAIRRSGIPYTIVGNVRFYERKEIKDVLAYLRLLANPDDEASLIRVYNYPLRGIGESSFSRISSYAASNELTLFEAFRQASKIENLPEKARVSSLSFANIVQKYRSLMKEMSLSEIVRSLVDELGIVQFYKMENTLESLERMNNVLELFSGVSEYAESREDASLEGFLEEVSLVSDIDSYEGTRNAVTLMTLHSSKGLEFSVVMITGLEEGLLPLTNTSITQEELEEERRLLYVGMTRAKERLYMLHSRIRNRYGTTEFQSASRFLSDIKSDDMKIEHFRIHDKYSSEKSFLKNRESKRVYKKEKWTSDVDKYFDDSTPSYEDESQAQNEIKTGAVVNHQQFGKGVVLYLSGKGDNMKVIVEFENVGSKTLMLKYANLELSY